MKILLTIAGLNPKSGGPSVTLPELHRALRAEGVNVELLTTLFTGGYEPEPGSHVTAVPAYALPGNRLMYSPALGRELERRCAAGEVSLIHDNGLWLANSAATARAARRHRLPLVVSPRGTLSPWALQNKRWKKRIAWWLFQRRALHTARALHATSLEEMQFMRDQGLRQPVAVIPNAVPLPPPEILSVPRPEIKTALFVGRIHRVKNLDSLLRAWALAQPRDWRLILAGPDEEGHQAELTKLITELGLDAVVSIRPPVYDADKWSLYRSARLFFLPSHSENFGAVVPEALACGAPVIASRGTPWQILPEQRCGWWAEPTADGLAAALQEATRLPDVQLDEMGVRGARLVDERFSSRSVARRMCAVYKWLLGGPLPDSIHQI